MPGTICVRAGRLGQCFLHQHQNSKKCVTALLRLPIDTPRLMAASSGGAALPPKRGEPFQATLDAHVPLRDKCRAVAAHVQESAAGGPSQRLRAFYGDMPSLLNRIFGLDPKSKSNWFAEANGKQDVDALAQLLDPGGAFFELLLRSVDERRLTVRVPLSALPAMTQRCLGSKMKDIGQLSPFFQSKLRVAESRDPRAQAEAFYLDLFEYYVFCFALMATRGIQARYRSRSVGGESGRRASHIGLYAEPDKVAGSQEQQQLYMTLLEKYLQWLVPTPTSTPQSSAVALDNLQKGSLSSSPQFQNRLRTLSKPFLQLTVETWLPREHPLPPGEHKMYIVPTPLVVSGVSLLVRHLVSALEAPTSHVTGKGTPYASPASPVFGHHSPYARERHSLIYERAYVDAPILMSESLHILQRPLWDFLSEAFSRWPVGSTIPFSTIIDIWLAYIMPWKTSQVASSHPMQDLGKKWKVYVFSNLAFYTRLVFQVLAHAP